MARNIDDLWKHLDARLDAQDQERKDLADKVGKLEVQGARVEQAVAGNGETCAARHGSTSKRVGRLEGLVGVGALAAVGAFCKIVWDAATGTKGN